MFELILPTGVSNAQLKSMIRRPSDNVGLTDALNRVKTMIRRPTDTVGTTDAVVASLLRLLLAYGPDPVGIVDSAGCNMIYVRKPVSLF